MNRLLLIITFVVISKSVLADSQLLLKRARIQHSGDKHTTRTVQDVEYFDDALVNASQVRIITSDMSILFLGSFRNMENLETLQIPKCGVKEIRPSAFLNVPKLDRIQLQDNEISRIEKGVFNNMNLSQLYLHRNKINYIDSEAFDNMPKLQTIKLNANQIKMWDSNWFFNTPRLTEVFIRRNYISRLEDHSFKNIKKLQAEYSGDQNLTSIYLSKNQISWIHPQALSQLVRLNQFFLDRNNLSQIPEDLFAQIETISVLSLRRNKIMKISARMFPKVGSFGTLDLTKNELECIPEKVAIQAKKIVLEDNFISCQCMNQLKNFVTEKGVNNNLVIGQCATEQDENEDEEDEEEDEVEEEE